MCIVWQAVVKHITTSIPRFQRHDKSHYLILDFALNFHQFNMHVTWTQNRKSEAF